MVSVINHVNLQPIMLPTGMIPSDDVFNAPDPWDICYGFSLLKDSTGFIAMSDSSTQASFMVTPRTIAGIPVTTFSYIFLAIGGAAPVLFIIIVIISMKCYSWRKIRRYRQYASQLQACKDIWDFERSIQLQNGTIFLEDGHSHEAIPSSSANFDLPPQRAAIHRKGKSDMDIRFYPEAQKALDGAKLSSSNPNVFFKETPLLQVNGIHVGNIHGSPQRPAHQETNISGNGISHHNTNGVANRKIALHTAEGNAVSETLKVGVNTTVDNRDARYLDNHIGIDDVSVELESSNHGNSIHGAASELLVHGRDHSLDNDSSNQSLSSDELKALACFDNIYDSMDATLVDGGDAHPSEVSPTQGKPVNNPQVHQLGHDNLAFVGDETDSRRNKSATTDHSNTISSTKCDKCSVSGENCTTGIRNQLSMVHTCSYPLVNNSEEDSANLSDNVASKFDECTENNNTHL